MNKYFKPIMISFSEKEYKAKQKEAEDKLMLLDDASVWIANTIDASKCDMRKLSNNMTGYFKDLVLETFMNQNTLGLSADKLIEAKEINIGVLYDIQKRYDLISSKIEFEKNVPSIKVKRKDFETWTTSEKQNKKLVTANKLISALIDMDKEHSVAKMFVNRMTNGYVMFDMYDNGYKVNPEVLN